MSTFTLEESRQWCHEVMRSAARNFYYGMSLLPEEKRHAMFALYAFMRHIDDIADSAVDSGTDKRTASEALEYWRRTTHEAMQGAELPHPMFASLRHTVRHFCIPMYLLDDAIEGQLMDMHLSRYGTFEELKRYCYCVASTVGIAAIHIWGYRDSEAISLAYDRGVAFQLTNILRDIREDYERGRIYLPQEDLERFGVDLDVVLSCGRDDGQFLRMMQFQIDRANAYYQGSAGLEELIAPDSRATLRTMTSIYGGILERIARDPAAVLSRKVGLSTMAKLREVGKELWRTQLEGRT